MAITHATTENFHGEVNEGLVLVDLWATWCGPCKMIAPVLDELDTENYQNIKIVKVDVDKEPDIAKELDVMSIPTLLLYKDGVVVDKHVGFTVKEQLQSFIDNHA